MLDLSSRDYILIQRGELAVKFSCVPSQINYVLSTRFTPDKGFLVESRRGGGGHIRITRISPLKYSNLSDIIRELQGKSLGTEQVLNIAAHLYKEKIITRREAKMMEAAFKELDVLPKNSDSADLKKQLLLKMIEAVITDK